MKLVKMCGTPASQLTRVDLWPTKRKKQSKGVPSKERLDRTAKPSRRRRRNQRVRNQRVGGPCGQNRKYEGVELQVNE